MAKRGKDYPGLIFKKDQRKWSKKREGLSPGGFDSQAQREEWRSP